MYPREQYLNKIISKKDNGRHVSAHRTEQLLKEVR